MDYKLVGNRIKEKRHSANITQEQLAEILDVSVGYISQIERGYTKPNLDMLSDICNALNCDIVYLLYGTIAEQNNYLNNELSRKFSALSQNQRQMVIDFIDLLVKYQDT